MTSVFNYMYMYNCILPFSSCPGVKRRELMRIESNRIIDRMNRIIIDRAAPRRRNAQNLPTSHRIEKNKHRNDIPITCYTGNVVSDKRSLSNL